MDVRVGPANDLAILSEGELHAREQANCRDVRSHEISIFTSVPSIKLQRHQRSAGFPTLLASRIVVRRSDLKCDVAVALQIADHRWRTVEIGADLLRVIIIAEHGDRKSTRLNSSH